MEKVILLRYGEIHLKGANRGYFEHMLLCNIKHTLKDFKCVIKKVAGRYEVGEYDSCDEDETYDFVQESEIKFDAALKNAFSPSTKNKNSVENTTTEE